MMRRSKLFLFALGWTSAMGGGCAAAPPVATSTAAPARRSWLDPSRPAADRARAAVEAMTEDEKMLLLLGYATGEQAIRGFKPAAQSYPGSAGYIPGLPRLGLPPLWESDGSVGVSGVGPTAERRQRTALPSVMAIAATWDPELAQQGGAMIGREARASGYNVLLAGSSVLTREPRSGRNFENAGEDPWLNGTITGSIIKGVQSARIIATLKHFTLNAQETGRTSINVAIDDTQARMADYLASQIAIERSHPGSVMCAYNEVNGEPSCGSRALLTDMLKGDWGYEGFVMSDWGAVHSTVGSANGGLDQQSGWPFDDQRYFGQALRDAVRRGEVPQSRLDDMVFRIVRAMFVAGIVDEPVAPGKPIPLSADAAVSRSIAEAGIVLLKNEGALLPLAAGVGSIAVIGGHADAGVLTGGGSAQVHPAGGNAVPGLQPSSWPGPVVYIPSSPLRAIQRRVGARASFASGDDVAAAVALARRSDLSIVFATQWTAESLDASLSLGDQDRLIAAVRAANPRTIVVIESGGPVLMPWLDGVPAVMEAWYPGADGGEAIARVLFGEVDAAGRLPVSFPRTVDDLPRRMIDGSGLPDKTPFTTNYGEGAAVGYKWFESRGKTPLFPFGHGLSYTRFAWSDLSVTPQGSSVRATISVRNTGDRPGIETVQLFASPSSGGWEAQRRLVGYARLSLRPGESRSVALDVDPRLLATWNAAGHDWRIAGGRYLFRAAQPGGSRPLGQIVVLRPGRLAPGTGR